MDAINEPRLGVDFGGVIKRRVRWLLGPEDDLRAAAVEGAFDALGRLVADFGDQAWIISKCGDRTSQRILRWLDHNDFYDRTGLARANVRFCKRHADKAVHCRELAITHMVDDRLAVHRALRGLVTNLYLFGPQRSPAPDWVCQTLTWADVEAAIGPP